jgi:putative nucleotidyltransferase with HDIG domain
VESLQRFAQQMKLHLNGNNVGILKYVSLYIKLFLVTVMIFGISVFGIVDYLGKHIEKVHFEMVKEELRSLATIAVFNIDGDAVARLRSPLQEETAQYRSLQKTLIRMRRANPKIDDLYIMRKGAASRYLIFVANAYLGKGHIHAGTRYDVAQAPDVLRGFVTPVVDREITTDQWGQMLSGYAPVKNSQGFVVGILGIDYKADDIKKAAAKRRGYIFIYSLLGMIAVFIISFIAAGKTVRRLNNIKDAIDMLLEEKLNVPIRDSGNDEIKILAAGVNRLIEKTVVAKEQMLFQSTSGLIKALEAKDPYTHGHSAAVAAITADIMNELGLDARRRSVIGFAAILHDIGKIGINDTVLNKPGKLTDDEFALIKQHPIIGEKILEGIPSLDEVRDIVRHHHERYDGKGYPDQLFGEQIHFGARIITVADSFQAMISDRPYRKGLTQRAALEELRKNQGVQFDPEIVAVFLSICKKKTYKQN